LNNNRPVGLWMLPAHVGASRGSLAALQRDFNRLRTLEHPHIAGMLELGNNGQQYYVTGERLDGEPLREVLTHLSPERLDVGEADDIVRAIGSALVYAHEHDIAHGDVRAENVVVTMDRRFVLTNFLARRVAKVGGRPPRVGDDLKGLARLAAELYTGSTSAQALRAAAHGVIPAARLNAIRSVLEGAGRRSSSVAEFLDAAGLSPAIEGATLRRPPLPQRTWPLWRFVLPVAAVAALVSLAAFYHGGVSASAEELKVRGLGALRAVAARVAPATTTAGAPERADSDTALRRTTVEIPDAAPAPTETTRSSAPPPKARPPEAPPPEPEPTASTAPKSSAPARPTDKSPSPKHDPAVVSLDVPRIAAREDHSVVAIDIVRSGDTSQAASVEWWTTPGTAHEEEDYARTGRRTVTFAPGATVERVLIPIVDDGVRESDEVFTVHLSRPSVGVAGTVTATRVTLLDDD
jgi:Calx-beta domain-containing protein/protein kinase-like protein